MSGQGIKTCCVTGHRDIPAEQVEEVKRALRREIEKAIADGYTRFLSGFAEGTDQYFAEIVAEKRKENEALRLEAVIPYRKRCLALLKDDHTKGLLESCTDITIANEEYRPNVYNIRNRQMVLCSDRVIAVYDGRAKGGTVSTIRMAHVRRKELREIPVGLSLPNGGGLKT